MSERRDGRRAPAERLLEEWLAHHATQGRPQAPSVDPAREVLAALGVRPAGHGTEPVRAPRPRSAS